MAEYAVITTLNEGDTIGALVETLRSQAFEVIVIDDASEDDTQAAAFNAGADVVVTGVMGRRGIAHCLMRAWRRALRLGAKRIVQLDAGDSHDPMQARLLVDTLVVGDADMVIGSRFRPGASYDNSQGRWSRPYMSRACAAACNWATGAHYTDWTSGYRAFTAQAAHDLLEYDYLSKMHGWQIEVLARANAAGMRIVEQPISYVAGRTSFNLAVANEAINAYLQVLHHIGGCTDNNRLSVQEQRR